MKPQLLILEALLSLGSTSPAVRSYGRPAPTEDELNHKKKRKSRKKQAKRSRKRNRK